MDVPVKGEIRDAYERIASSFAETRKEPWPEVADYVRSLPRGSRVLDLGCGHGRHMRVLAEAGHRPTGVDFSPGLLRLGRARLQADWIEGEATALPIRGSSMDACVCAAVLHHLPTHGDRIRALREVRRVIRPNGSAFVTVWSADQPRFEALVRRSANRPADVGVDTRVPWALPSGGSVPRYYHLFAPAEFKASIIESGLHIERFFMGRGNLFVRVSKDG